jgi:probable addiction module antidote protein
MTSKTSSYRDALLESLSDPIEAAHYLNAAIGDSPEMFRKALRNVAQSRQMAKVAREAGVTRESLYRATSEIGNPTLDTLDSVLQALGLRIQIVAGESAPTAPAPGSLHADVRIGNTLDMLTSGGVAQTQVVYHSHGWQLPVAPKITQVDKDEAIIDLVIAARQRENAYA